MTQINILGIYFCCVSIVFLEWLDGQAAEEAAAVISEQPLNLVRLKHLSDGAAFDGRPRFRSDSFVIVWAPIRAPYLRT